MKRFEKINNIAKDLQGLSDDVQNSVKRLLSGDVITLNYSREEAYINYYVGKNTEEVDWKKALLITSFSYIELDSGNIQTKEDHYRSSVLANDNEITSSKSVVKYKL